MLEQIFGGKNVEKVLFYLLINERCYGQQLSRDFQQALFPLQKVLARLEVGGVVASFLEGRNRIYQFNPRYPFLKELKAFCQRKAKMSHSFAKHKCHLSGLKRF